MPPQYSYQPDAGMLQQYYATAMPQAIVQTAPVNPEQLSQYSQQVIPTAIPVPEVQNYAPQQQVQQQAIQQAQPQFQVDPRRSAYNKLIQDRFDQIINHAGGMQNAIKANAIELFQQKAAKDIESYYGPPPAIAQPLSELERAKLEQEKLALEQAKSSMESSRKSAITAEVDKAKAAQANMSLASDVVSSVDKLLADQNALQWAGGMTGSVLGVIPGSVTKGVRQQIEQLRDQIGLFGRKAIVGQGQGSISDAEQKMAKEALAQVITEGTDEQLIGSLKAVRQKFGGILERIQAESSGNQSNQPTDQPVAKPTGVRTYVPGKGFQD